LKDIVEFFSPKKIVFKSLNQIDNSLLKTRKKILIYSGTDVAKSYHALFVVSQKSRFLLKNAQSLEALYGELQKLKNHNFKYKHLLIGKNICSKTIHYLENLGWKIYYDFV